MQTVPFENSPIERYRSKDDWDATAAELVGTMLDRWHLTAGAAYVGGEAASVLQVSTADGTPAVLKVGFPHLEAIWEAVALESWGSLYAPSVLRQDPWTWSLLLEKVEPGIPMSTAELPVDDALRAAAELYRDISARPVPPGVATLKEIMAVYLANAHARMERDRPILDRLGASDLVDRGLAEIALLAETDGSSAFLHGDYNPGNVLSSGNRWFVIDPKPMAGDPEFDLFPLIQQLGAPLSAPEPMDLLEGRLLEATRIVGCDPARTARWCFARCALNISWLLDDGDEAMAASTVRELTLWSDLLG